ncbi:BON domain-containing protein [Stakelama marina]|uniref:Small-conductance mechanosensitive channel n=1 Tax=Stakelama marina TaxID=2826939 RepID=A0A8T4IIF7_9SPHN|nr:BON domain-containing protein [Stakelama marina]MBR0553674.1 mechanosensitive ion channel [Stakelama marina]
MLRALLLFLALVTGASGASAQLLQNQAASAPPQATSTIEAKPAGQQDAAIAERIRGIFSQIDALTGVTVQASQGVVTLSGTVPTAADVQKAEAIAGRVSGVVTVQNQLSRNLAVNQNISPVLGQLRDDLRGLVRALPLIGVALAIAVLIALLGYLIAARERFWRWVTPNSFLAELVQTSIRFVFVILGLVAALELLGATALLGAVLGGAGVIGIALGFAVRDTVDNYVSSLMLSLRQPFRANDHVVIEGSEGRVVRLTSRATVLMTLDGNHLRIPNSVVFKAVILNYTRNPERRFQFDLGVDADDNPVDGMAVGLKALRDIDFVLDEPKASAIIQDVGDSNIVLRFYGWVDQTRTDFFKGRSVAIQTVKSALEDAGFALPEPIYRLRFDEGAPLPLKGVEGAGGTKPAPVKAETGAEAQDTAPEAHIEKLVAEERAEGPEDDLLDNKRPIE